QRPILGPMRRLGAILAWLSQLTSVRSAGDIMFRVAPADFWGSLVITHALGWLALVLGSLCVQTSWQERQSWFPFLDEGVWPRSRFRNHWMSAVRRGHLLDLNPFFWLSLRDERDRWLTVAFFGLAVGLAMIGWIVGAPEIFL